MSTQLRESKKCLFQLQFHHQAVVNRRLYIKLTEQADKELENDIFAAIEQQRQEFETELSDGGKLRSKFLRCNLFYVKTMI